MSTIQNSKFIDRKQRIQVSVNSIDTDVDHLHDSFLQGQEEMKDDKDEEEEEELIRVVLRQNPLGFLKQNKLLDVEGKVRKTLSMRAGEVEELENPSSSSSSVGRTLRRRAFSMRLRASSNSVNQVYRRIDHQYDPVPVGDHDLEENNLIISTDQRRAYNNGNRIFEACKRLFRF